MFLFFKNTLFSPRIFKHKIYGYFYAIITYSTFLARKSFWRENTVNDSDLRARDIFRSSAVKIAVEVSSRSHLLRTTMNLLDTLPYFSASMYIYFVCSLVYFFFFLRSPVSECTILWFRVGVRRLKGEEKKKPKSCYNNNSYYRRTGRLRRSIYRVKIGFVRVDFCVERLQRIKNKKKKPCNYNFTSLTRSTQNRFVI